MLSAEKMWDLFTNSTADQDWTQVYGAVRWIQLVMALLSVLGAGSILVCIMSQRLSRMPELQPLFLLALSDLLLALCWLLGAALFSQSCSSLHTHCYYLHTVEQTLYLASFFYTLNYVWGLHRGIRDKLRGCTGGFQLQFSTRVRTATKSTALLSGLLPLLLMTPVFVQGSISRCEANASQSFRCLLIHTGALDLVSQDQQSAPCGVLLVYRVAVFLLAFCLTLLSVSVLVVRARRSYRRVVASHGYLGNEQQASLRLMDRRMLLYPLVFVLCWGPAVALTFLRVVNPPAARGLAGVVLYVAQAFTSASQGFLNSLVYGWTRAGLRRAGRRVLLRDVDTQTPLLMSQKKKSYRALGTAG
ncbi:uncharacterized protein V6R79_002299 [Siganus canaliculatus]